MSMAPPLPPPLPYESVAPSPARFRPTAAIAWGVIVLVCVALPVLRANKQAAAVPATMPVALGAVDFQTELAGRVWVGVAHAAEAKDREQIDSVVGMSKQSAKSDVQRVSTAIVLADLGERDKALAMLEGVNDPAAGELLALYDHPTTSPSADVATMRPVSKDVTDRFGFFARLANVYGRPDTDSARAAVLAEAERTFHVTAIAVSVVVLAGLTGLVLFIIAIVRLATGRLRFRVGRPVGPGYIYAEAVAVYLGGFVVVSVLIGLLLPRATLLAEIAGLGGVTLVAAAWPLVRGARWADLRQDWGIHTGTNPLAEMASGLAGYLAGLPLIAVGLVVTVSLLKFANTDGSHPIVQQAGDHSALSVLSLYFIASVFAPITEELMFRGALVSHLRGVLGVAAAAVVSGIVFGAVHPQGWAVVPALAGVGAVLACVRQWRGSLLASITAHAVHNGFLITILTLATR